MGLRLSTWSSTTGVSQHFLSTFSFCCCNFVLFSFFNLLFVLCCTLYDWHSSFLFVLSRTWNIDYVLCALTLFPRNINDLKVFQRLWPTKTLYAIIPAISHLFWSPSESYRNDLMLMILKMVNYTVWKISQKWVYSRNLSEEEAITWPQSFMNQVKSISNTERSCNLKNIIQTESSMWTDELLKSIDD